MKNWVLFALVIVFVAACVLFFIVGRNVYFKVLGDEPKYMEGTLSRFEFGQLYPSLNYNAVDEKYQQYLSRRPSEAARQANKARKPYQIAGCCCLIPLIFIIPELLSDWSDEIKWRDYYRRDQSNFNFEYRETMEGCRRHG